MTISYHKGKQVPDLDHDRYDIPLNETLHEVIDSINYVIPLVKTSGTVDEQWNIVQGDNRQFPVTGYSQAQWDVAYNNKIGIQKALDYAAANGYNKAMLPPGHYNICYSNVTGDTLTDVLHNEHDIRIPSNFTLDLNNNVTVSVIFDSDTTATSGAVIRNPYDTGSYLPNELPGNVFSFSRSYSSYILGGTVLGEMCQRSFVDSNEAYREFTNGVFVHRGSTNCGVYKTKTIGFAGDGHTGVSSHNPDFGSQLPDSEVRTFYTGLLSRVDGTVDTGVTTAYTTNLVSLSNIDRTKCNEIVLRTNLGFTRIPDFANQHLILCWYDTNDNFIASEDFKFLQIVKIPNGAEKIRMCCQGEASGPASVFKTLRITPPFPNNYDIIGCTISECHRGGISNMVNNTVIAHNKIYNNGLGWRENYPVFPDGTRFGINCEDGLANLITIRDNDIDNSNHGILMSGLNIHIENNNISNCTGSGVVLYYIESATVTKNRFTKCGSSVGFIESVLKRDITFSFNTIDNCKFSDVSEAAYLNTDSTTFTAHGNKVFSPHAFYKCHTDYLDDFIITDHVYNQTPLLDKAPIDEYIRGKYSKSVFNLKEGQASTNYVYTMTAKGSDLVINCDDPNRRIGNEGTVYGLSQNGGKQYRALVASSDRTYNFYGEGHAILKPDQFEFPQFGTPSNTVHTINIYDFKEVGMNGGFSNLFNFDTNSTDGTTTLNINIYNSPFIIDEGIGGTLFHIDYAGANHNVNIKLYNCKIDTSKTSETVYLADRHSTYVNEVQLTMHNTEIIGSLDQTALGYNVTVLNDRIPEITSKDGNVGISVNSPSNKLDILCNKIGVGDKQNNSIALCYDASTTYGQHYMDSNGIYNIESIVDGAAGGNLQFKGDNSLRFVTNSSEVVRIGSGGNVGVGITDPKSVLDVNGGVKVANDTDAASADKVGTLRYRETGTDSYVEMCMKTGASTYAWEIIKQNTF
jgi:hypothetical protein